MKKIKSLFIGVLVFTMLFTALVFPPRSIETVHAEGSPIAAVITQQMKSIDYIITSSSQSTTIRNFLTENIVNKARFSFFNNEELLYYFEFVATEPVVNAIEYDVIKYDSSFLGNYYFRLNSYAETGLVYSYSKNGAVFSDSNLTRADLLLTSTTNTTAQITSLSFLKGIGKNVVNEDKFTLINSAIIEQKLLTLKNGNETILSAYYPVNFTVNLPNQTKTGYTFAGWLNSSTNETVTTSFIMPNQNTNLEAIFNVNTYTINFVTNGGSEIEAITIDYNATLTLPTATRTGYTFAGWFENSALTNEFTATTMPASDLTLYAKWAEDTTVDPIDPNDPNPTDPTNPGTGGNGNGWFDNWPNVGEWFKDVGNGIGKTFKNIGDGFSEFWASDAGKITVIVLGSAIVIAGVAGLLILLGSATAGTGGSAALAAGLKFVAAKAILPALKLLFASPIGLFILGFGGIYLGSLIFFPDFAELIRKAFEEGYKLAKEGVEATVETIEFIDKNIVDPIVNATGLPKVVVWPLVVITGFAAIKFLIDAIKELFNSIFKATTGIFNRPKKQPKQPKETAKNKTTKEKAHGRKNKTNN